MDRIQKDIIADMHRHAGNKRDKSFVHGVIVVFVLLVAGIFAWVYWALELNQPSELLVIAAPESAKVVPEQEEPQDGLRVLSLNDPEAAAKAAKADDEVRVVPPQAEEVLVDLPIPKLPDDEERLARLQKKILAGLETEPQVAEPDLAGEANALKTKIIESVKP